MSDEKSTLYKTALNPDVVYDHIREKRKFSFRNWAYYKEAWQLTKADFKLQMGVSFVFFIIANFVSLLTNILFAGYFVTTYEKKRGIPLEFDSFFRGFKHFMPLFVYTLVTIVIEIFFIVLFGTIAAVLYWNPENIEATILPLLIGVLTGSILGAFVMQLFFFSPLFILFGEMKGWESVVTSTKIVLRNPMPIIGFVLIEILLAIFIGIFTLGLGFIILIPVINIAHYLAFEDVFPLDEKNELDVA